MTELQKNTRLPLNNGGSIPILGLGVWQLPQGSETEEVILSALTLGYRHIDTAKLYQNEESVGKAIKKSGIPREEIFITTKLWPTDAFDVESACTTSLKKLNVEYVDLYLIHWPIPLLGNRTWTEMEALQSKGLAHAIGVSNYTVTQLQELLKGASVPPAVNQIEFNPFAYQKELLDFCLSQNIVVEAYSPLTRGLYLDNTTIAKIGKQYGKSAAQILLRWGLQKGTVVLPKSGNPKRIAENADIFSFSLSEEDMRRIDTLSR